MSGSSVRTSVAVVLLFLTLAVAARAEGTAESALILLDSQIIDTSRPQHLTAEAVAAADDGSGEEVVLVKFPGPVTAGQQRALAASGVRVYTYLPHHAYLAKAPAGWRQEKAARLGASWTGLWLPSYKISRGIAAMTQVEPGDLAKIQPAPEDYRPVMLHVLPDADVRDLAERLKELGLHGITASKQRASFSRLRLLLSPAEIAAHCDAIAALGEVFWIDRAAARAAQRHHHLGRAVGALGRPDDAGLQPGIFGEGQTIAWSTPASTPTCAGSATRRAAPPHQRLQRRHRRRQQPAQGDRRRLPLAERVQRRHLVDGVGHPGPRQPRRRHGGGGQLREPPGPRHGRRHGAGRQAGDPGRRLPDRQLRRPARHRLPGRRPEPDLPAGLQPGRAHPHELLGRQRERRGAEQLLERQPGRRRVHVEPQGLPDLLRGRQLGPAPARSAARRRRRAASRSAPRCAAPRPSPWPRSPVAARPPTGGSSRRSRCPGRASSRRTTT